MTPETHPEHFCQRCGGPNLMCWHAPSPLWNTVMRDTEGQERYGIVCPRCFGELAREKGVADFFCLTTHDAKVPLPSVFGDGRVWDADKCKWVEADAMTDEESLAYDDLEWEESRRILDDEARSSLQESWSSVTPGNHGSAR